MANPFLNAGRRNGMNPMQVAQICQQIQNDPSQLPDLMLRNNRIDKQQYNDLKSMNGNVSAMGQYLLQRGVLNMGN